MALTGKHTDLTEKIMRAFFKVYNTLGYGFSEKVYENALCWELASMGLQYDNERKGSLAWTQSSAAAHG